MTIDRAAATPALRSVQPTFHAKTASAPATKATLARDVANFKPQPGSLSAEELSYFPLPVVTPEIDRARAAHEKSGLFGANELVEKHLMEALGNARTSEQALGVAFAANRYTVYFKDESPLIKASFKRALELATSKDETQSVEKLAHCHAAALKDRTFLGTFGENLRRVMARS